MSEKIYLNLLILCGIFCQGIIATLLDEDTKESSNFFIRKRRVIHNIPGRAHSIKIEDANYIVNIQKNGRAHCAGAILSHYTVITAAPCVSLDISQYHVISAARYETQGDIHRLTWKDIYYGNPPHQLYYGLALVTVDPPFVYSAKTGYISLYFHGPLEGGTQVTVSGWGCTYSIQPGPTTQRALRSIHLPIMNREECHNVYRGQFPITEKHICTYDERKYCAQSDAGAPLVVNHQLAGIHIWKGEYRGQRNPDVFINLQHEEYSAWIRNNTILM